jgi:hypothetical protein
MAKHDGALWDIGVKWLLLYRYGLYGNARWRNNILGAVACLKVSTEHVTKNVYQTTIENKCHED